MLYALQVWMKICISHHCCYKPCYYIVNYFKTKVHSQYVKYYTFFVRLCIIMIIYHGFKYHGQWFSVLSCQYLDHASITFQCHDRYCSIEKQSRKLRKWFSIIMLLLTIFHQRCYIQFEAKIFHISRIQIDISKQELPF